MLSNCGAESPLESPKALQSPKSKKSPVTMSNPSDQFGILKDFFFFLLKGKRGP